MSGNKDSDGGWRTFLWNSEKKEFLGRTGGSWCEYSLYFTEIKSSVLPGDDGSVSQNRRGGRAGLTEWKLSLLGGDFARFFPPRFLTETHSTC